MPKYIETDKKLYDMFMEGADTCRAIYRLMFGFAITLVMTVLTVLALNCLGILPGSFVSTVLFACPFTILLTGGLGALFYENCRFQKEMAGYHTAWRDYGKRLA